MFFWSKNILNWFRDNPSVGSAIVSEASGTPGTSLEHDKKVREIDNTRNIFFTRLNFNLDKSKNKF